MLADYNWKMAFLSSLPVSSIRTKSCVKIQQSLSSTRIHFQTGFISCATRHAKDRVRSSRPCLVKCSAGNGNGLEQPVPEDEKGMQKFIENLDAKPLRWAEIPFSSIEEELNAIDDYEREEELKPDDVWPKFLRGAAYEYWGHPHLALVQYAKTDNGSGLRRVPEIWERRGYNSFKIGKVGEANAYFDVGLSLFQESCGNELHFVHWFYSHFQDYIPKWNGPSAALQRGICKYCMGYVKGARESFLPEVLLKNKGVEHAILWFLAASARMSSNNGLTADRDLKVVKEILRDDYEWDPRLLLFIDLFCAHGEGVMSRVSEVESVLMDAVRADKDADVSTYVYLAVYHDAFTGDEAERDRALDTVGAIGTTGLPNDTENFLFCAAKNRLSAPPDAKKVQISEKIT